MNKLKQIGLLVLAILLVIVVLQNTQDVETRLLFFDVTLPRALLLLIALLLGFALGVMMSGMIKRKARKG